MTFQGDVRISHANIYFWDYPENFKMRSKVAFKNPDVSHEAPNFFGRPDKGGSSFPAVTVGGDAVVPSVRPWSPVNH